MLAPLQLPAAGVHGAERRDAEGELRNLALDARQLERIQRELVEACSEHPGLHLENKGVAFALHFARRRSWNRSPASSPSISPSATPRC